LFVRAGLQSRLLPASCFLLGIRTSVAPNRRRLEACANLTIGNPGLYLKENHRKRQSAVPQPRRAVKLLGGLPPPSL
jgi:hypothetical protein